MNWSSTWKLTGTHAGTFRASDKASVWRVTRARASYIRPAAVFRPDVAPQGRTVGSEEDASRAVRLGVPKPTQYEADAEWHPRHRYDLWWWYRHHLPGWIAFFLPILLAGAPIVVAAVRFPEALPKFLVFEATIIFALDVAIAFGLIVAEFQWYVVLLTSFWMEFLLLIWLLKNLEFLRRFQWLDRFFRRRETRALDLYQRRAWIRRFHFWGVVLFTFLPLNSGVILGVLVGKVTGMSDRRLFAAVYFGIALWASFIVWIVTLSIELFHPIVDDLRQKLPGV